MVTTYEIMTNITGTPANEVESMIAYFGATAISIVMFFAVVYLIKVIGQLIRRD